MFFLSTLSHSARDSWYVGLCNLPACTSKLQTHVTDTSRVVIYYYNFVLQDIWQQDEFCFLRRESLSTSSCCWSTVLGGMVDSPKTFWKISLSFNLNFYRRTSITRVCVSRHHPKDCFWSALHWDTTSWSFAQYGNNVLLQTQCVTKI